jgi:hypothetical protein
MTAILHSLPIADSQVKLSYLQSAAMDKVNAVIAREKNLFTKQYSKSIFAKAQN